jgi:hypothetical protein
LTGALIGMGIPEFEAKRYEGRIKEGNVLVSVHTEDDKDIKIAKAIFEDNDAQDISFAKEVAAKATTVKGSR